MLLEALGAHLRATTAATSSIHTIADRPGQTPDAWASWLQQVCWVQMSFTLNLCTTNGRWNLVKPAGDIITDYRTACAASSDIVNTSLETVLVDPHPLQAGVTLRWTLIHD